MMRAFSAPLTSAKEHVMTPLRQRMIEDMKLRNLAPRTIEVYVERVATFAKHFDKSPDRLGPAEVRAYLLFLVQEKHASWSYYNQALCALRLLYHVTLGKKWVLDGVVFPKRQKKLPVVLSPAEVTQFFAAIPGLKYRAILMTAYAGGPDNLLVRVAERQEASATTRPIRGPRRGHRLLRLRRPDKQVVRATRGGVSHAGHGAWATCSTACYACGRCRRR
jgi:integrase